MPVSLESPEAPLLKPNIFGFFRYLLRVSPYNCSRSNPIRFLFVIFSLLSFLALIFRAYWMFFQISSTVSFSFKKIFSRKKKLSKNCGKNVKIFLEKFFFCNFFVTVFISDFCCKFSTFWLKIYLKTLEIEKVTIV